MGQRYLFSYFKGNGEDGLHLAYSEDGLAWRALNDDRPYFHPTVGKEKLTRDPSIVRGPDGMYHMVWTAGWNEQGFGYAESRDLITWTHERYVAVMSHEPTAMNTWAPEIFYDSIKTRYQIVWASTIPGRFPGQHGRRRQVQPPALLHDDEGLQDLRADEAPLRSRLQRDRRRHHQGRHALRDVPQGRAGEAGAEEHPPRVRRARRGTLVAGDAPDHRQLLG